MSRHVQHTLAALGLGAVAQRLAALVLGIAVARALGPEGFGRYALAAALGTTIAALAGSGLRAVASRGIAREPDRAGSIAATVVRLRLIATAVLLAPVLLGIHWLADDPWPWVLGALVALPLAVDLKGLLDAAGRTSREVGIDCVATTVQVGATLGLLAAGMTDLTALLAMQVAGRTAYAALAALALRQLPGHGHRLPARTLLPVSLGPAVTQTAVGLLQNADVWLVRACGGEAAAGLYAVAQRLAAAAALPAMQLARLLQPHNDRAAATVGAAATAARALRGTAFAILPPALGGAVLAAPLCELFGAGFAVGAPALRLLLAAACLQQFGWIACQVLFAHGRRRAWATAVWSGALVQAAAMLWLVPEHLAAGGAAGALLGHGCLCAAACTAVQRRLPIDWAMALLPGIAVAAATAAAALATAPWPLAGRLAAGAGAFAASLYALELRHTGRRFGQGLGRASGFGA